jgi:hypothetical protein
VDPDTRPDTVSGHPSDIDLLFEAHGYESPMFDEEICLALAQPALGCSPQGLVRSCCEDGAAKARLAGRGGASVARPMMVRR